MGTESGTSTVAAALAALCMSLACAACGAGNNLSGGAQTARLPQFSMISSNGKALRSDELRQSPLVVVFFDANSILAWRFLKELEEGIRTHNTETVSALGVLASRERRNDSLPDIPHLAENYRISFPLVADPDRKYSALFQTPTCCDAVYFYRKGGDLYARRTLSEMRGRLESELSGIANDKPAQAAGLPTAVITQEKILHTVMLIDSDGTERPIRLATKGVTLVNLFDAMCTECATGERLETLKLLSEDFSEDVNVIAVFSRSRFSERDLDNFRSLFKLPFPLFLGNVESTQLALVNGMLLAAFDAEGRIVWQTKSGLSELEIYRTVKETTGRKRNS